MPPYGYRAIAQDRSIVEGSIEADDERGATEALKNSGLLPLEVIPPKSVGRWNVTLGRVPYREILAFTTELSVLLDAGLPLDRSLRLLAGITEHKKLRAVVEDLLRQVREGRQLSEAMGQHPRYFSRLYVSMVRAGEAGGVLEVVMGKLAEFLETSKTVRDQVVSALVYPLILLTFSGISVTILFTVVLPRFTGIFDDLGQTIPLPARVLLGISGFLTSYGLILLAVCTAGGVLVYRFLKTDRGRRWLDGRILALFPELTGRFHAARLGRTLGTLLKSGVPLLQALGNSRDVLSNRVVSDAMATVISRAREGEGIAAPLARTECFPTLAVSMIRVGEETGRLDEMLLKVAATFEKSLYVTIRRLLSLVEPLMIVLMALVVGSILAVMVYTVFSVNDLPF